MGNYPSRQVEKGFTPIREAVEKSARVATEVFSKESTRFRTELIQRLTWSRIGICLSITVNLIFLIRAVNGLGETVKTEGGAGREKFEEQGALIRRDLMVATLLICVCIARKDITPWVRNGHDSVVKLLLNTDKVEVDAKDYDYSRTPLSYAAENGRDAVVKLLLDTGKFEVDSKDTYGRTPLSYAAENGHNAVVKLLLDTGKIEVDSENISLLYATRQGHDAVVKLLLHTGTVEVDSKNRSGRTPQSYAASHRHSRG